MEQAVTICKVCDGYRYVKSGHGRRKKVTPCPVCNPPRSSDPAIVVHFRDVKGHWNPDTQQWDDLKYVYIGRANATYNLPQSMWANPFKIHAGTNETQASARQRAIQSFRIWIMEQPQIAGLSELRGKTLVCWCKESGLLFEDRACHGDVLVEMLRELESKGRES